MESATLSNAEKTSSSSVANPTSAEVREAKLKIYDRLLATISAFALLVGGMWGLYTYSEQKKNEYRLRERELNLMIYNQRKEAYYALSDAACDIAACRTRQEVVEKSHAFLKLYNGRAHIVPISAEDHKDIFDAKVEFKRRLLDYLDGEYKDDPVSPFKHFEGYAYQLTLACQKQLDPRSLDPISK